MRSHNSSIPVDEWRSRAPGFTRMLVMVLARMTRVDPPAVVNIADLRHAAKKRLPRVVFDYIDGGADAEWTMRENARVFDDVMFRPRSAVATASVDLRTTVLGATIELPF